MTRMRRRIGLLAAIALLGLPLVAFAGQASPAILADSCAACHGTDGKSPGAMPSIRGKAAAYLEQRLKAFKTDKRSGTVMNRIAKGYTDAEITAMAQYFASK